MPARRPALSQPRRPDERHGRERRAGLDVEADAVALLDRGDRAAPGTEGQGRGDREAGADGRDAREEDAEDAGDQREGAERPQPGERDPVRVLGRQGRGRPRLGQQRAHRVGGAGRAAEDQADREGGGPPDRGDDQGGRVEVGVRRHRRDDAQRGRSPGREEDRHSQQVAELHGPRRRRSGRQRPQDVHEALGPVHRGVGPRRDLRRGLVRGHGDARDRLEVAVPS